MRKETSTEQRKLEDLKEPICRLTLLDMARFRKSLKELKPDKPKNLEKPQELRDRVNAVLRDRQIGTLERFRLVLILLKCNHYLLYRRSLGMETRFQLLKSSKVELQKAIEQLSVCEDARSDDYEIIETRRQRLAIRFRQMLQAHEEIITLFESCIASIPEDSSTSEAANDLLRICLGYYEELHDWEESDRRINE